MTDHEDPFDVSATVPQAIVLTSGELLGLFGAQLDRMERNILDAMAENSRHASERWRKHDEELAANAARVVARFVKVEGAHDQLREQVAEHHRQAHDEETRLKARVEPVRTIASWVFDHWERLVLIAIFLGVAATFLVESFGRALGPHAP